jgi:hypothetical protein
MMMNEMAGKALTHDLRGKAATGEKRETVGRLGRNVTGRLGQLA